MLPFRNLLVMLNQISCSMTHQLRIKDMQQTPKERVNLKKRVLEKPMQRIREPVPRLHSADSRTGF